MKKKKQSGGVLNASLLDGNPMFGIPFRLAGCLGLISIATDLASKQQEAGNITPELSQQLITGFSRLQTLIDQDYLHTDAQLNEIHDKMLLVDCFIEENKSILTPRQITESARFAAMRAGHFPDE